MDNLFDPRNQASIIRRLEELGPTNSRQWGKMDVAQMLAHCAVALEFACGDRVGKQALLGRLITPLIRSTLLGDKPFGRNGPTGPDFVIKDSRDFATEKARVTKLLERFHAQGPDSAGRQIHSFFGRLSGDEWGRLMYKHLDHHLRQFSA